MIINSYMDSDMSKPNVKGLILAGPSMLKHKVKNDNHIVKYLDNFIIKVLDISEISDRSVLDIYNDNIKNIEELESTPILDKITDMINKGLVDKLRYGNEIIEDLESCLLEYIVIDKNIDSNLIDKIKKNNNYGCSIEYTSSPLLKKLGGDIIGIRWY